MAKKYSYQQTNEKSRNYLAIILIIVFTLLSIGLIINIVTYFRTTPQTVFSVETENSEANINNYSPDFDSLTSSESIEIATEKGSEFGQKAKETVTNFKSPKVIIMNLFGLILTGGSFWLLLFLRKFDQRNYYNVSNSFTLISNNRFFYISLIIGVLYAFYIGGVSLFKNTNIDTNLLIEKSTFIQIVYTFLSVVLLIENFIKTGFSIPIALARSGIFITIGITLIVVGYIFGMLLFYIFIVWLVFKVVFGMITAGNRRKEEQDRIDRLANSIVDAFERRWNL